MGGVIERLTEPCWVVLDPNDDYEFHRDDRAAAVADARGAGGVAYRRSSLCWIRRCDRCTGLRVLDEDDRSSVAHYLDHEEATRAEAEDGAACEDCAAAAALGSTAGPRGEFVREDVTPDQPPYARPAPSRTGGDQS